MMELLLRRWYRLRQVPHPPVIPWQPSSLTASDPAATALSATRGRLESILQENITPFWRTCLDSEDGGYRLNHDADGCYLGPASKYTIPQARTCWFFSRLHRVHPKAETLEAARLGFRFLHDQLWDRADGGFFWSIPGAAGGGAGDDRKHLLAQSFGLYAIAEYASASGDPEALGFTGEIAGVLEQRFGDRAFGGYLGGFRSRSWVIAGSQPPLKTVNEHMHVLEAYAAAFRTTSSPWIRDRLLELVLIHTTTVVRKRYGAVTDAYDAHWNTVIDSPATAVSYGHDLEAVWLVTDACQAINLPVAPIIDWIRMLGELTLRWGWDRRRGGVYFYGPLDGPAVDRRKVWWVQAEVLVGSLLTYRMTGDRRFADLYLSTLDWVERHQVDHKGGDWHAIVQTDGRITGKKADQWKSPYHNGRAMLTCLDLLDPGMIQLHPGAPLTGLT